MYFYLRTYRVKTEMHVTSFPKMTAMGRHALSAFGIAVLFTATAATSEDGLQRELLARKEAMESGGLEQAALIQKQAKAIKKIEEKLESQDVKIAYQEHQIQNYKQRIDDLEQKLKQLLPKEVERNGDSSNSMQSLQPMKMAHSLRKARERVRRFALNSDSQVAFHALISKPAEVSHIGVGQKIIFPRVNINLGGGYHNLSGVFIAPRAGLYLFSTSITAYALDHTLVVAGIRKNGNNLGGVLAQGENRHHDQGSFTAVTQLDAGDEVWVSLDEPADTSLWGGNLSSFMGCLLIPQ